jgi:protein-S-isoprenylcysteine O-methyltransferase Ste14
MAFFLAGTCCLLLTGILVLPRARRELESDGRISLGTFVPAFLAYVGHGLAAFAAAWRGAWLLPIPETAARIVGGVMVAAGVVVYLAARVRFRGFRLAWGLTTDRLITDGIYRFSRNPQVLSWIVVLTGTAILGRSMAALLLAAVYLVSCIVWLPIEERILERRFGEEYRRYRQTVPRYLGLARRADAARAPRPATSRLDFLSGSDR